MTKRPGEEDREYSVDEIIAEFKDTQLRTPEERQADALLRELGQACYDRHQDDPDYPYAAQIQGIREAYAQIAQYQAQIRQIKGIRICPQCGAEVGPDSAFCGGCGAKMEPPEGHEGRVCPKCGSPAGEDSQFCAVCGTRLG